MGCFSEPGIGAALSLRGAFRDVNRRVAGMEVDGERHGR